MEKIMREQLFVVKTKKQMKKRGDVLFLKRCFERRLHTFQIDKTQKNLINNQMKKNQISQE
jgi:hypothetical protein